MTLVSDSEVIHYQPLHRLWAKSNNRERGQFECARHIQIDHALYTWFCFCFDFVRPHARCGCCSKDCWRGWTVSVGLKLDVQLQRGGKKMLDVDGQVGGGVLKIRQFSWTSYVYRPLLLSWVTFWR